MECSIDGMPALPSNKGDTSQEKKASGQQRSLK